MGGVFNPLSAMQAPQQGAMNSVAGAAPPPQANPQFDIIGTVQRLLQMPQFQEPTQQLTDIASREKGVSQQLDEMSKPENMPQRRYEPKYEHGAGAGGALRNVGRGILQGLSFTGPGQSVQEQVYGPGVKAYGQKKEALAGELSSLKGEEETAREKMSAATGITGAASLGAYRGGQLENTAERNRISQERATIMGQKVANEHAATVERLSQGWDRLAQGQQKIEVQKWYDAGLLKSYNARIDAGQAENEARIGSQQDMKAAADQSAWIKAHPFLSLLGIDSGTSVSTPRSAAPKPTVVKPPGKSAAPSVPPGATHAVKVNGKIVGYSSDGGKTMTPVGGR